MLKTENALEPEVTQYWRGLTRIDGVTRAAIDQIGNSVRVKRIDSATKSICSVDDVWYNYSHELGYFLSASD